MRIFSLKLYNVYYIHLTFYYHYKNRVCVTGHQTIPRPQQFCKLLSPFWNFWIHFWSLPLPLHVPHKILSRNIPVSKPILYCKINYLLRRNQIEKKSCSKLCLSVQKRKEKWGGLLYPLPLPAPSPLTIKAHVTGQNAGIHGAGNYDRRPSQHLFHILVDWLVLMPYRQYISHLPAVHIILEHPQASVRSLKYRLIICSALKDYQRSVKVHGEIFLIGVTLGFER